MNFLDRIGSRHFIVLTGLLLGLFVVWPNIINLHGDVYSWGKADIFFKAAFVWVFRYIIFAALCSILLYVNIYIVQDEKISERFFKCVGISAIAYGIYVLVSLSAGIHADCFTGTLLFQFFVTCLIGTTIGHFYFLYKEKDRKDNEIEKLKIESLQSRCDALASQINPHFFFNSLNGLTSLIRDEEKEKSLDYIVQLSNVFRYILQSDKKGLVTLREELNFVESFSYLQEVRYEDKFRFIVDVPENRRNLKLPVLSLLPLIENIVKHNMVDSENPMMVRIFLDENNELIVSNPIHEKLDKPEKNGIGLTNLVNRFELLIGKGIRVNVENDTFIVHLPLKH
ncbi:MAG: histidine kinase [Tannerellaceae bacterium]|nr:histidine kinase [Tannerellaceae bacterium]